jgi:sugar/nucleoside kinase (ribokinase family)
VTLRFLADELEVTRRVLERREPPWARSASLRTARPPAQRRDRPRGANDTAERERPESASAVPVHETILFVRLTTLGDLLLDVIVRTNDHLEQGDDTVASVRLAAGGQAANVAAWAASLGATARVVGTRGDDFPGQFVSHELRRRGVEVSGPRGSRTGIVVSLAAAGERTMASDRGSAGDLPPDELDDAWFECDVLHISGYALLREPAADAAFEAARRARRSGATVAVDLASFALIDDAFRERLQLLEPDIVFAGEREQAAAGLLETRWVAKRGRDGVIVDGEAYRPLTTEVVDATGAGDAFAAGFHVGGVDLGLEAAARCCSQVGAMP